MMPSGAAHSYSTSGASQLNGKQPKAAGMEAAEHGKPLADANDHIPADRAQKKMIKTNPDAAALEHTC